MTYQEGWNEVVASRAVRRKAEKDAVAGSYWQAPFRPATRYQALPDVRRARRLARGLIAGDSCPFFATMGNPSKISKREERKQRSEAERQHRELAKRSQKMRSRAFLMVGVVAALVIAALAVTRRQGGTGQVWSAEHGHYHDASGKEIRRP